MTRAGSVEWPAPSLSEGTNRHHETATLKNTHNNWRQLVVSNYNANARMATSLIFITGWMFSKPTMRPDVGTSVAAVMRTCCILTPGRPMQPHSCCTPSNNRLRVLSALSDRA
jgi:hypothetical protein